MIYGEKAEFAGLQSASGVAGSPKKMSQTEQELSSLSRETKRLSALVTELRSRLAPILRSVPTSDGGDKLASEALSPLPQVIRDNGLSVANANYQLNDILERLEL